MDIGFVAAALLGGLFGVIFFPEYPELFVILGISAVLGASMNNPITAIIIIVEMTWEPFLFITAGITTIIAYIFFSRVLLFWLCRGRQPGERGGGLKKKTRIPRSDSVEKNQRAAK